MNQTIVVFHDEAILAARGRGGKRPQVSDVHRIELQGYGEPFGRWKDGLTQLVSEIGREHVRLVLPSALCPEKYLILPYGRKKELAAMAEQEMKESFKSEIFDYGVIHGDPKGGVAMVGASVEENILTHFLNMCSEAGLTVDGVTASMEGTHRILTELMGGKKANAIYLFFEEGGVLSVLMEEGQYRYSGKSRLFSEPGTLDYGTEIVRNISGILQFQIASKSDAVVTDVYYAGCPPEDFEVSLEGIEGMNLKAHALEGLPGVSMPAGEKATDWLSCIGAMMCGVNGKHDINLLEASKKLSEAQAGKKAGWRYALPVAVVFGVCVLVLAVFLVMNFVLRVQADKKYKWIEAPENQEAYQQALAVEAQAERIEEAIAAVRHTEENLSSYPELTSEVIRRISSVGGSTSIRIRGYDSKEGILTFEAGSTKVIDIPSYIEELQATGLFHKVDYTGYTYEDEIYTLSLSCTMKESGRGGEAQ